MADYIERFRPDVTKDNDTLDALYGVEADEIESANLGIRTIAKNTFLITADGNGVSNYEQIFDVPYDAEQTLEQRKGVISYKFLYRPPITRQKLTYLLDNIFGEGNYIYELVPEEYYLKIDVDELDPILYPAYVDQVKAIAPANMRLVLVTPYTHIFLARNYTYGQIAEHDAAHGESPNYTYGELSKYVKIIYVRNMYIDTPPTALQYTETPVDLTGLVAMAIYNDDSLGQVTPVAIPDTWGDEAVEQTVTLSYTQVISALKKQTDVTVTVPFTATPILLVPTGLAVTTPPAQTEYIEELYFDPTGMVVTPTYNSGRTRDVTDYTYSPQQLNTVGTQPITITYTHNNETVTTTFNVTVVRKAMTNFTIQSLPSAIFYEGDTFDATGVTALVEYNNGNSEVVSAGITYSPTVFTDYGTQVITASYTFEGVTMTDTFEVEVHQLLPTYLTINGDWGTTPQYAGTALNTNGLTFTATYNNGTTADVTDEVIASPNVLRNTTGIDTITFTYTHNGVSVTATKTLAVILVPTNMTIHTAPNVTQYTESLVNMTGAKFNITYSTGETQVVDYNTIDFSLSINTWGTSNTQTNTITYTLNGVSVTVDWTPTLVTKIPSGITVLTPPTKTSYYVGDTVDNTGAVFRVIWNSGASDVVTYSTGGDISHSPLTLDVAGTHAVTYSYTYNNVTVSTSYDMTVIPVQPASLAVSGNWTNEQIEGYAVDPTGLVFTVTYNNGTTAIVTNSVTISPSVWNGNGTQSAIFTYSESGEIVTVTKEATVLQPLVARLIMRTLSGSIDV